MESQLDSDAFPGFDALYVLSDPGSPRAFVASVEVSRENALSALRGEASLAEPVIARWAMGVTKPGPIIWTTLALPVLVNEEVVELLRAFSGWDTLRCDLRGKRGESLPGYHFLRVSGRCGRIDEDKCKSVQKQFPGGVFSMLRGLFFDPASWDGSDVFMPNGEVGWIFVTERVQRALQRARIGNVLFSPADRIERIPPPGDSSACG